MYLLFEVCLLIYSTINSCSGFNKNNKVKMRQTSHIRKRVSFTPIMLTSKSIRPVDRGDYELTRNQQKINRIKKNRKDLSNLILKEQQQIQQNSDFFNQEEQMAGFQGFGEDTEEECYRKLVRKMTTPTVVKVEFQKQIIRNRRRAELKLKELRQAHGGGVEVMTQPLKGGDINKAFYFTNAKTFQQFTKMNKIRSATKKPLPIPEDETDQQWKRYLNKYYLSIRKVKPLMKKDDGMRLLSPQKIGLISNLQQAHQQTKQSRDILQKTKTPFRSHSKRQSRHFSKREMSFQNQPNTPISEEMINAMVFKRIEQDIGSHKTQNKKDFFVFGLSQNNSKSTDAAQIKVKMEIYWDFIFRVNFTNGLYVCTRDEERPLKFFVGFGNNSALIKGMLRRRYWWQSIDKPEEANFIWTQLKLSDIFKGQRKNRMNFKLTKHHRNRNEEQPVEIQNGAIMVGNDLKLWERYYNSNLKHEEKGFINALTKRAGSLLKFKKIDTLDSHSKLKIHNHLECNYFLGNKKALFYSMRKYYQLRKVDPFSKIPLTFHITQGLQDPEFENFLNLFQNYNQRRRTQRDFRNIWIVKPGELTNRGRGITVCSTLDEIKIRLKSKQKNPNGTARTFIIQKYIEKPLLYQRRKFDIRHYMAISCTNGRIKGYWYADGYIRTTSCEYNVKNTKDLFTHLTNDAVQKNGQDYGKFQKGNKISYNEFKKYLNSKGEADFYGEILPKMRQLATDTIRATYSRLDPERREHNFQLFGLDFMLDQALNVYLIEVNTNPCLEQSCPLQTKILIPLVDNLFKICLDPLFPPPVEWPAQRKHFLGDNAIQQNKFTLIFDECEQGHQLRQLYQDELKLDDRMGDIDQQQQQYNDEDKEWNEQQQIKK